VKINMMYKITTTVSPEMYRDAQEHGIKWCEAMRVGLSRLLAQKGLERWINPRTVQDNLLEIKEKIGDLYIQINQLETTQEKKYGV